MQARCFAGGHSSRAADLRCTCLTCPPGPTPAPQQQLGVGEEPSTTRRPLTRGQRDSSQSTGPAAQGHRQPSPCTNCGCFRGHPWETLAVSSSFLSTRASHCSFPGPTQRWPVQASRRPGRRGPATGPFVNRRLCQQREFQKQAEATPALRPRGFSPKPTTQQGPPNTPGR